MQRAKTTEKSNPGISLDIHLKTAPDYGFRSSVLFSFKHTDFHMPTTIFPYLRVHCDIVFESPNLPATHKVIFCR